MRTAQLQKEFGLTLRYTVFPLHPETPDAGMALAELFAGRGYDLDAMFARLHAVAAEVGLPLNTRTHTYNSRRAQELGKWAETLGKGDAFRDAIYHAFFVDGRNIARPDELTAIVRAIGLSADTALKILQDETFSAAVDADWQRARQLGVNAVPTLRYREQLLVGFTPYETMRKFVAG